MGTRPGHHDGVQGIATAGIADVVASKRLALRVAKCAVTDLRGPLAVDVPGGGAVDGLAVDP